MTSYDVVIKDGLVFDGTGAPRVRADVAISDGRVAAIGRVDATDADQVIDARGMHVAPGFVDLHTHYDAQVFWDPYLHAVGLARRHVRRDRQLRLRVRAGPARAARVRDALDDAGRGDPATSRCARACRGTG